jgi:ATP-dependent protease ClpP protease subunit
VKYLEEDAVEEKASEERGPQFNYDDWLCWQELKQGIVRLDESVRESSTRRFLREIETIKKRQLPEALIVINSPGGGAYYAFAIYDAIRDLSKAGTRVIARVEGYAASAAAMIVLQAADVRQARPHARFLLHEIRRWVFFAVERTSDLKDEVQEMNALTAQIIKVLSERCGKTASETEAFIERREVWMSSSEALDWNLIDEVL